MAEKNEAYASFEQKWLDANPEQAMVAIFLEPRARATANAFGTLIHEIAHTTFGVREPQVAAAKLGWWHQELADANSGHARHPISRELFRVAASRPDDASWRTLIDGAIAQLDAPPAVTFNELVDRLGEFYGPVAEIDATLRGDNFREGSAEVWIGSHLLSMFRSSTAHTIDLPLDILARHGATRAGVNEAGPGRSSVLNDFIDQVRELIATGLSADGRGNFGSRVRARLDLHLADGAVRATDPADYIATRYHRLRWRGVWLAWREARAQQRKST